MLKKSSKKRKNQGFTLVELVIVIAILAILVGLLAPQYTKYVEKSRKSADIDNLEEIVKAFQVACADVDYSIDAGEYSFTLADTGVEADPSLTGDLETALNSILGAGWNTSTKLKGSWDGAVNAICEIDTDGGVTITYSDAVASYSGGSTD